MLTEAVRLVEASGPLDDAAAMREAARSDPDIAHRVAHRAAILAERMGLPRELDRLRRVAPFIALVLAVAVAAAGLMLAGEVVGTTDRRINIMVALASLLGLHLLMLGVWLAGFLFSSADPMSFSFGGLWAAIAARVAGGRHGQAGLLVRAGVGLLVRARMLTWAAGLVSHCIWALSFGTVLVALVFALSFRRYSLGWETTILDPAFFVSWVRGLGVLPGLIGFPVPDVTGVVAQVASASDQRVWALWLTGCIVVYGLLPRVLLAALCGIVLWRCHDRLSPDLSAPYFQKLATRFDALAPGRIVDGDPGTTPVSGPRTLEPGEATGDLLIVGFELPPEFPGVSDDPAAAGKPVRLVEGSAREREELVDLVARLRPRVLLMICHATATPDRGTERLLRALLPHCAACRLYLWSRPAAPDTRWRRWLDDVGLHDVKTFDGFADAIRGAS